MARATPLESYAKRMGALERRSLVRAYAATELVDTALSLYQKVARPVLKATAVPMILCLAGLTFYNTFVLNGLFTTRAGGDLRIEATEIMVTMGTALGVALPLLALGLGSSMAATVSKLAPLVRGDLTDPPPVGGGAALRTAQTILLVIAASCGVAVLSGIGILAGAYAERTGAHNVATDAVTALSWLSLATVAWILIPVGLCVFAVAPVVCLLESAKPLASLRRARKLMRTARGQSNAYGPVVGAITVLLLVGFGLGGSMEFILGAFGLQSLIERTFSPFGLGELLSGVVQALPTYVTLWFLTPIWTSVVTLLYFDRRVRLEAYDIRLLTEDILAKQGARGR
ncbi:MAG: hypothetical protein KIT11_01040 [Fimbriimonadaceae bacterium]|nr:hypothetical protein [Fimbriimonadaceae bacterium]QYK55041.1 MAG: hypothetical protein KF733_08495 [Fimbriimonadaceae bacterium]